MNIAIISGNVGKAETKQTTNGIEYTSGSVATTHGIKKNDKWENVTTWHNVKIWKPSDYTKANFVKGARVMVQGRIENTEHEGKYYSSIVADKVEIFTKSASDGASSFSQQQPETPSGAEPSDDLPF